MITHIVVNSLVAVVWELPVNDTNKIEHGASEGAWNLYKAEELFGLARY